MSHVQPPRERGQILAIFALSAVAIVAMTGLVLDGGFTFVQRRDQQNVADAAALAAAYAYGNSSSSTTAATAAAQTIATVNGYANGAGSVLVNVAFDAAGGAGRHITVTISKPHQNYFAGIVGMSTWTVSTTATTETGRPNAAIGAIPIIFNEKAIKLNGTLDSKGNGSGHAFQYGQAGDTGPNPIPQTGAVFNWTMYCDSCNAKSSVVAGLITDGGTTTVVTLDDKLDPLNSGAHTDLFDPLEGLVGKEFPIPIVNDLGRMVGWSMFHLTASDGKSTKTISGWFVSPVNPSSMTIMDGVTAGGDGGSYVAKLVN